jgi:hypothetical protein
MKIAENNHNQVTETTQTFKSPVSSKHKFDFKLNLSKLQNVVESNEMLPQHKIKKPQILSKHRKLKSAVISNKLSKV